MRAAAAAACAVALAPHPAPPSAVVFFPADKAGEPVEPFEYQGARDLAGFVAFLNEHASVPVKLVAAAAAGGDEEDEDDEDGHDEF